MSDSKLKATMYAFMAAVFYALNIPLSKLLLKNISPVFMAAVLYIGAGLGVGIMYIFNRKNKQEQLSKKDLPYVISMIVLDSIAPIFLMEGVNLAASSCASLIGNFEIVATALLAMLFFHEKISGVLWLAISLITLSGLIISYDGDEVWIFSQGALLIILATLCWGLENNCTRIISNKDTYQIVTVKGICSGLCSMITAIIIHEKVPDLRYIFPALLLGFVAYGLSIFTYVRTQKTLGAAKTSAYYSAAPFIGAIFSFVILREPFSIRYFIAFFIMAAGTLLVIQDTLKQSHTHKHRHVTTYVQGGAVHIHVITHAHVHNHYLNINRHVHEHTEHTATH